MYRQDKLVDIVTSLGEVGLELYSRQEYKFVFSPQWAYAL